MSGRKRAAKELSLAFLCDRCGREAVQALGPGALPVTCPGCGMTLEAPAVGDLSESRLLSRCLRCGLDRLYVKKDFNKKAGLWVFVVAALLSVPTWGLSLLAATIIDLVLYFALGDATLCYGCGALHRGFRKNPDHGDFDIHIQEAVDRRVRTA